MVVPTLSIPDIRDYERINLELVQLLEAGHPLVLLSGAEKQRLIALRLRGPWKARVVIDGEVGPELAAELDAPGVTVICRGNAADGAGRSLKQGRLVILGSAGEAVGMNQQGGRILVQGAVGARAGLRQSGGDLIVAGEVGPLASERRTGGRFLARPERIGPHFGRGATGGSFQPLPADPSRPDASTLPPLSDLLSEHDDRFDWIDSL